MKPQPTSPRHARHLRHLLLLAVAVGLARPAAQPLPPAEHASFDFECGGHRLRVWYYRPAGLAADDPVTFVFHGVGRNAEEYLADWIPHAAQRRFLLVVPEFSRAEFPGEEAYNSGHLFDAAGRLRPREQWSYSMVEPIFDAVRGRLGCHRNDYVAYGHSAGAQFLQRFLYFVPEARVTRAVAANAGWYMLPSCDEAFPYGLKGTPADAAALRAAFARPLVVLLGTADTDPAHQSLRHTPGADAQGLNRLARGQYFFRRAQAEAAAMGVPIRWTLATVPGAAHVNKEMASDAVRYLFPD